MNHPRAGSHLRQLARDYAEGRLDRSAYVRQRTQFLDALGAHQAGPSTDTTSKPSPAPKRLPGLWVAAAAGLVALAAVIAVVLLMPSDDATRPPIVSEPPPQPAPPPPKPEAATATPVPSVEAAIDDFLAGQHWGPAGFVARGRLLDIWTTLNDDRRAEAQRSGAFRRLHRDYLLVLQAERAARKTDDDIQDLLSFGAALGLAPATATASITLTAELTQRPDEIVEPPTGDDPPVVDPEHDAETATRKLAAEGAAAERVATEEAAAAEKAAAERAAAERAATIEAAAGRAAVEQPDAQTPDQLETAADRFPPLSALLNRSASNDRCARAAATAKGPIYGCKDRFSDSGSAGLLLIVVPAGIPFALTKDQYSAEQLSDWCVRKRRNCVDSRGGRPSTPSDQARAYAAWLSNRTGRAYRPATESEWTEAYSYGVAPPYSGRSGIRLLRELSYPRAANEAAALELWWRRHHRAVR